MTSESSVSQFTEGYRCGAQGRVFPRKGDRTQKRVPRVEARRRAREKRGCGGRNRFSNRALRRDWGEIVALRAPYPTKPVINEERGPKWCHNWHPYLPDRRAGPNMPRYFFHVMSGEIRQTDAVPGDQSAFDHVISGLRATHCASRSTPAPIPSKSRPNAGMSFSRYPWTSPSLKRERAKNQAKGRSEEQGP